MPNTSAPLSLNPTEAVMAACVENDAYACAIRDGWRFNFPIRRVTPEEFGRIAAAGYFFIHG